MKPVVALLALWWLAGASTELRGQGSGAASLRFDAVISGGRVLDPETGLDAVRDVGIVEGRVAAVSVTPLRAQLHPEGHFIDARGRVVAPGFIDLHAHGQSDEANAFQVRDGVTSALELEWGYPTVGAWLESRRGKARIHYGASASHGMLRSLLVPSLAPQREEIAEGLRQATLQADPLRAFQGAVQKGFYEPVPEESFDELIRLLDEQIQAGALGIGMAHQYYPGAIRPEILRIFEFAASRDAPIYTHVRSMGMGGVQEVVANAAATGAPLHIVHLNSSSLRALPSNLALIGAAQRRGLDITTEAYPYTAGSTALQSAIFDDGWQERLGISFGDLQWQDTGERLTEETFRSYRKKGGTIILHVMREEWIRQAMATPFVIIASDGMPYAPGAHPRSAGTFSRVLGRYVREQKVATLPEIVARMTLLPARRLERIAPMMRRKGRLQVGADADVVVFDPETVRDTATFEDDLSASVGIDDVLVMGIPVVVDGELTDARPGQPIRSQPGD